MLALKPVLAFFSFLSMSRDISRSVPYGFVKVAAHSLRSRPTGNSLAADTEHPRSRQALMSKGDELGVASKPILSCLVIAGVHQQAGLVAASAEDQGLGAEGPCGRAEGSGRRIGDFGDDQIVQRRLAVLSPEEGLSARGGALSVSYLVPD